MRVVLPVTATEFYSRGHQARANPTFFFVYSIGGSIWLRTIKSTSSTASPNHRAYWLGYSRYEV